MSAEFWTMPVWSRDGKEVFFIAPDRKMMAAFINLKGAVLEIGPPEEALRFEDRTWQQQQLRRIEGWSLPGAYTGTRAGCPSWAIVVDSKTRLKK